MSKKIEKKKYFKPLQKAELSLQFTRDAEGTPKFVITSNPKKNGEPFCTGIDALIFAKNFIDNDLTDLKEKQFLCAFFANVKNYLDKQEESKELKTVRIFLNGMVGCFNGKGEQMPELQGEWNSLKSRILYRFDSESVKYFYGEFGGQQVEIPKDAAKQLSFKGE